jgi:hypothetical protein
MRVKGVAMAAVLSTPSRKLTLTRAGLIIEPDRSQEDRQAMMIGEDRRGGLS